MAEDKITIRFDSIADEGQGEDILVGSPLEIFASVDTVDDLYLLQGLPEDEDIVVYVRNVLNTSTRQQSTFYKYDHEKDRWNEILLGTHSHNNKELLDQLSNIDADNIPYNENRILTLKKVDEDGDEDSDVAWKYKLEWMESPTELPEVPDNLKNSTVYLTTENGKYVWREKIVPTQTFQYKQIKVTNPISSKTIVVSDVDYNEEHGDQILLFDDGQLLYNLNIVKVDERSVSITINDTEGNHVFTNGETVTLLIIRNGITGFLDTLASEYLTKEEAIDIFKEGKSISLKNYAKKTDLDKKADYQHTHTQFSKVGHVHDDRYAMFSHTHDGVYIHKSEVYALLSDVLTTITGSDVEVDQDAINDIFGTALENLRQEFAVQLEQKATITFVEEQIAQIQQQFNTDDITVYRNGQDFGTLTDYLGLLQSELTNAVKDATDVKFDFSGTDDKLYVQIGAGNYVGGYKNGDIITSGTSVQEFVRKLFTRTIEPNLAKPTVELKVTVNSSEDYKDRFYEPGDKDVSFRVTPEYKRNDGGRLTSSILTVTQYKDGVIIYQNEIDVTYLTYVDVELDVYDGIFADFSIKSTFAAGTTRADNLGNYKYFVPETETTAEFQLTGNRKCFVGEYNGTDIRTAKLIEIPKDDFLIECKSYNNAHDIVLAFPSSENIKPHDVLYLNQGCLITDLFEYKQEKVSGANNYEPIMYDIYNLHLDEELNDLLYMKILIGGGLNGVEYYQ